MLSSPHKRFTWARSERFGDFAEFSFFRALVKHRRRPVRVVKEKSLADKRWKPAAWTPWLWMK